jgi:hypothetical protein
MLLAPAASADPPPQDVVTMGETPKPTTAEAPRPPAAARGEGGSYVAAGVAFGLAAVGLGVGAVAGGLSLSDAGTLEASCHAGLCPATERGAASTAKLLGNVSTASLIVGGAAALTGIAFLVVLPGPDPRASAAPSGTAPAARGAAWTAGLGLGRITLEARF